MHGYCGVVKVLLIFFTPRSKVQDIAAHCCHQILEQEIDQQPPRSILSEFRAEGWEPMVEGPIRPNSKVRSHQPIAGVECREHSREVGCSRAIERLDDTLDPWCPLAGIEPLCLPIKYGRERRVVPTINNEADLAAVTIE